MKTSELLNLTPVKVSFKKRALMPTASLAGTPFMENYKGCGNGIAYFEEIDEKLFVRAFNYGENVELRHLPYSRVEMSCTEICLITGMEPSLDEQEKTENIKRDFLKTAKNIEIFNKTFQYVTEVPECLKKYIHNKISFGFFQSNVTRYHDGRCFRSGGFSNESLNLLPKEGAFNGFFYELKNIGFTSGYGSENINVIPVTAIYFYVDGEKYEFLVSPNAQNIEKKLNERFSSMPFENISEILKARWIYKYPAK